MREHRARNWMADSAWRPDDQVYWILSVCLVCRCFSEVLWDCQRHLDHWESSWSKELMFWHTGVTGHRVCLRLDMLDLAGEATLVLYPWQICAGSMWPHFCHWEFQLGTVCWFLVSFCFRGDSDDSVTLSRWVTSSWPHAMQKQPGASLVTFLSSGMAKSCSDSKVQGDLRGWGSRQK